MGQQVLEVVEDHEGLDPGGQGLPRLVHGMFEGALDGDPQAGRDGPQEVVAAVAARQGHPGGLGRAAGGAQGEAGLSDAPRPHQGHDAGGFEQGCQPRQHVFATHVVVDLLGGALVFGGRVCDGLGRHEPVAHPEDRDEVLWEAGVPLHLGAQAVHRLVDRAGGHGVGVAEGVREKLVPGDVLTGSLREEDQQGQLACGQPPTLVGEVPGRQVDPAGVQLQKAHPLTLVRTMRTAAANTPSRGPRTPTAMPSR